MMRDVKDCAHTSFSSLFFFILPQSGKTLFGFGTSGFGKIGVTTNEALGGGGGGGQSTLYTPGGPRSAQFTIKMIF
jgi:hypothetical protein